VELGRTQIDSRSPGPSGQSRIQDFRIQGCPDPKEARSGAGKRGSPRVLFTRTIRRTMVCGLVIVLVMMILLSVSAIYSHISYRQVIRDLDYSFNKCPRKHELTEAVARLQRPLKHVPLTRRARNAVTKILRRPLETLRARRTIIC
jgi:hypothetical protein